MKLKEKNIEKWNGIIKEFNGINSIGHIAYKYNVKRSVVENAWLDEFGVKKTEKREKSLFGRLITCPVCGKKGNMEYISRHIMNSSKEPKHNIFIKQQDQKIRELYMNLDDSELDPYNISYREDLYCSPSYIRKIFSEFDDYETRLKNKRSIDTKKQYKDGRRKKSKTFNNGWKLTRENGGKRFLSNEKIEQMIRLYDSNLTQNEISEKIGCKNETVHKYWVSVFGKEEVSKRNRKARIEKITKTSKEQRDNLKKMFYEEKTIKEISNETGISAVYIENFYQSNFSSKERIKRFNRIQPYVIKKSLIITGKKGITGSYPEQMCYKILDKNIKYKVIHHDFNILPPYEIDITIPELKIAISWDGPFHRKNIFGEKALKKTMERDNKKICKLKEMEWKVIVIEDNVSKHTEDTIKLVADNIFDLIDKDFDLVRIET